MSFVNIAALQGPAQPQYIAAIAPEEFVKSYERWCSSQAFDEDTMAAKFEFCFNASVRTAVTTCYDASYTWNDFKQKVVEQLYIIYRLDDFEECKDRWEAEDTIQRYGETVGLFRLRFELNLRAYERARQREGVPALTEREKIQALQTRLYRELQTKVISKRDRINTLEEAWTICIGQENVTRRLLREQRKRASYPTDPSASVLRHRDAFGSQLLQASAQRESKLERASQLVGAAPSDQGRFGQLYGGMTPLTAGTPLMPARASLHGDPNEQ